MIKKIAIRVLISLIHESFRPPHPSHADDLDAMVRRYSKKKGPVRSKKVTYDGITFQSGLEKYMYIALKKANIKAKYEGANLRVDPFF